MKTQYLDGLVLKNSMYNTVKLTNVITQLTYIIKNGIEGSVVECGVWRGGCMALVAKILLANKQNRVLHLFDSFDDPPEPALIDGARFVQEIGGPAFATGKLQAIKGYYKRIGKSGPGNEKEVHDLLVRDVGYDKNNVKIYKGWLQDTLPVVHKDIGKVSLLMLDCGTYAANSACLKYLYDKVTPKGIVIVDDYYIYDGCTKAIDEYLAARNERVSFVKVNKDCVCWVK